MEHKKNDENVENNIKNTHEDKRANRIKSNWSGEKKWKKKKSSEEREEKNHLGLHIGFNQAIWKSICALKRQAIRSAFDFGMFRY